jgi:hypothetical protein
LKRKEESSGARLNARLKDNRGQRIEHSVPFHQRAVNFPLVDSQR